MDQQTPATGKIIENSVKIVIPEKLSDVSPNTRGQIHAGYIDKTCIVQLSGLMTWQMAAALREMMRQAKERATPPFHIDLTKCDGMDSTMLGLLLLHAGEVILHAPGKRVASQIQDMGVMHLFTIDEDQGPHPQVSLAITSNESQQACTDLILSAHEALMEASVSNRQKFTDVVEALRHGKADT